MKLSYQRRLSLAQAFFDEAVRQYKDAPVEDKEEFASYLMRALANVNKILKEQNHGNSAKH